MYPISKVKLRRKIDLESANHHTTCTDAIMIVFRSLSDPRKYFVSDEYTVLSN